MKSAQIAGIIITMLDAHGQKVRRIVRLIINRVMDQTIVVVHRYMIAVTIMDLN